MAYLKKYFHVVVLSLCIGTAVSGCGSLGTDVTSPGAVSISVSDTIQLGALLQMGFPDGGSFGPMSECGFEVTVDGSMTVSRTIALPSPGNDQPFASKSWVSSVRLSGLKEGAVYSVRAYVNIPNSKAYSSTIRFTTSKRPTEWVRLADLPNINPGINGSCIINGNCGFGFGDLYDRTSNTWTALRYKFPTASYDPYSQVVHPSGQIFLKGNILYRFSDSLQAIDTTTSQITSYPNDALIGRTKIIFSAGDAIYAGGGSSFTNYNFQYQFHYYKDFWKFDMVRKTWQQLKDMPVGNHILLFSNSFAEKGYSAISVFDSATGAQSNELWEYDTKSDTWTKKGPLPGNLYASPTACSDGKQIYVASDNFLWSYDPTNDSWKTLDTHVPALGILGTDGTTIYFLGIGYSPFYDNRFWKFAP